MLEYQCGLLHLVSVGAIILVLVSLRFAFLFVLYSKTADSFLKCGSA